jgi:hypothetical protein
MHFTVFEIPYVLERPIVVRGKGYFWDLLRMKKNMPNLKRTLIFNSQKCHIKVDLKCEIISKHKLTDIQQRGSC